MAYEILKFEKNTVTVCFNGENAYQNFTVPRDENGNFIKDALINHLNHVDFMKSTTPNNAFEIEALVVSNNKENEECANCARKKRNLFLALTDWTQIPDSSLSEEEKSTMTIIRQELRDITTQAGFPTDIQWPEIPTMDAAERQRIIDTDFCRG